MEDKKYFENSSIGEQPVIDTARAYICEGASTKTIVESQDNAVYSKVIEEFCKLDIETIDSVKMPDNKKEEGYFFNGWQPAEV